MCDCCRPSNGFISRHSNHRNHDTCPTSSQWQSIETPCNSNSNNATTTTQTQTCHHHTQTQSQSLTRTTPPNHRIPTYDIDVFNRSSPNFPCSLYQQSNNYNPNSSHQRPLESLLRDLLNHAIYNNDTIIPDCLACHALCHVSSQTQRDQQQQQCTACTTDTQQLISLLLNFLERLSNTTSAIAASNNTITWPHNHRSPLSPSCRLHSHNNTTASNRHQRTTCTCHPHLHSQPHLQPQLHCPTCPTTHEQTKSLIDVLLRITRRRSQGRNRIRVSTRCRRCTYPNTPSLSRSHSHSHPIDLTRVIRRLLDEFESNNSNSTYPRCCISSYSYNTSDRESIESSLRRLRKALRDIEIESECDGHCDIDDFGEDAMCGCGCGGVGREREREQERGDGDCVEISRVTTYTAPAPVERRRPRVGNLHLGWVL